MKITKTTISRTFFAARISCGTYNTKDYYSKEYKTKSGLLKGLKSHAYPGGDVYNGETWNNYSKQYKITFQD